MDRRPRRGEDFPEHETELPWELKEYADMDLEELYSATNCGLLEDGFCTAAGSEQCDFCEYRARLEALEGPEDA